MSWLSTSWGDIVNASSVAWSTLALNGQGLNNVGRLQSTTYILGAGPDLSLIPVVGGQSAITAWWGIQLVGNKQSTVEYTPANVGSAGDWCVVIPSQTAPARATLGIVASSGQTADLVRVCNNSLTTLLTITAAGAITMNGTNKITSLGAATTSGDALSYGQSGASLTNLTLTSKLLIGSNPDFSVIPISNSQVAITSRRDLQLVGNRQSGVDYTPSVIGGDGYYSVIIPSSSNSTVATVAIRATVGQTIPMLRFEDGYGTSVGTIDSSGNIALVNKNISGVKTATFNTHQAITASTSATTIDFSSYQSATVTLVGGQATAFTLTSPAGPTACRLVVIQPASNMITPTWTTKPYAPNGTLTIAATASARTLIGLVYDGSIWYAVSSQPMTQVA